MTDSGELDPLLSDSHPELDLRDPVVRIPDAYRQLEMRFDDPSALTFNVLMLMGIAAADSQRADIQRDTSVTVLGESVQVNYAHFLGLAAQAARDRVQQVPDIHHPEGTFTYTPFHSVVELLWRFYPGRLFPPERPAEDKIPGDVLDHGLALRLLSADLAQAATLRHQMYSDALFSLPSGPSPERSALEAVNIMAESASALTFRSLVIPFYQAGKPLPENLFHEEILTKFVHAHPRPRRASPYQALLRERSRDIDKVIKFETAFASWLQAHIVAPSE